MTLRPPPSSTLLESLEPRLLLSSATELAHHPRLRKEAPPPEVEIGLPHIRAPREIFDVARPRRDARGKPAHADPPQAAALAAPAASLVSATDTQVVLSGTPANAGLGNYRYQWYRGTSAVFVPSADTLLPGATGLTLTDDAVSLVPGGLQPGVPYFYVLAASDGQTTAYSNVVIGALAIPTTPIALEPQAGPVLLAYIGSSTWAINQGSGQVPAMIDANLRAAFPAANVTTFNGAASGADTTSFLPGTALNAAVKNAVTHFAGYKVLRLMIGSNDAAASRPVSAWLSNMRTIIGEALTWPVNLVVLEEIGVRLDGGNPKLDLIRQYNAARTSLLGPHVVLGTAYTFENQGVHLSTLSGDLIHQTDAGQIDLASNQSVELRALFTPPTVFTTNVDNAAYHVSMDATGSFLQVSLEGGAVWSYALGALPSLTFNLLGRGDAVYFHVVPATVVTVNGVAGNGARLFVYGASPSQVFTLTGSSIHAAAGGSVQYSDIDELQLFNGTFYWGV